MLIGAVVLDEPLNEWLVLGAALVVGGIALTQRASIPGFASVAAWRSARSRSAS